METISSLFGTVLSYALAALVLLSIAVGMFEKKTWTQLRTVATTEALPIWTKLFIWPIVLAFVALARGFLTIVTKIHKSRKEADEA